MTTPNATPTTTTRWSPTARADAWLTAVGSTGRRAGLLPTMVGGVMIDPVALAADEPVVALAAALETMADGLGPPLRTSALGGAVGSWDVIDGVLGFDASGRRRSSPTDALRPATVLRYQLRLRRHLARAVRTTNAERSRSATAWPAGSPITAPVLVDGGPADPVVCHELGAVLLAMLDDRLGNQVRVAHQVRRLVLERRPRAVAAVDGRDWSARLGLDVACQLGVAVQSAPDAAR